MFIPCREGCDHAPFSSVEAEQKHFKKAHAGRATRRHNGIPAPAARPPAAVADVPKIDRRTKAWRDSNPKEAKPIGLPGVAKSRRKSQAQAAPEVKFCPCCGTNLAVLIMALALARKYEGKLG